MPGNSDEFVRRLAQLGVVLSVIPGWKEAGLSFSGASCDFPGQDLMVVDIGGGSTEMVVGRAAKRLRGRTPSISGVVASPRSSSAPILPHPPSLKRRANGWRGSLPSISGSWKAGRGA